MSQTRKFALPVSPGPSRRTCSKPLEAILSFSQYKARYGSTHNDGEPAVYDPTSEQFPDDEWYALEHDKINSGIYAMCMPLLQVVRNHPAGDIEVSNLNTALRTANIVPRGQRFYAAFLGEQGIGKSSLINAIFNRDLVNVSPSSSACTAYPTIITYKAGASDGTTESDVQVQYLNDEEIRDCAQEQARRYRDAFPCKRRDEPKDEAGGLPFDIRLEEEVSEDEDDDDASSQTSNNNVPCRKAIRPSVLRAAKTAKSFFDIIFDTEGKEERKNALEDDLEYLDIEDGNFAEFCVEKASQRLGGINVQDGFSEPDAISDEDLPEFQKVVDRVWPLVKSVQIATGHVLLRNNVCILNLPGYRDDNHIRTALVDKFREMANFEIVVAPTSRVVSNVVQERYLNRSIRRLGARNILLETNKSDQLFNSFQQQINKLEKALFPELKQCLASVEAITKQGTEDRSLVRAYIEREAGIVSLELRDKGVDILSVSAREYSLCLDAEQDDEEPKLTPEATGLPQLRRYLFSLPAQTNYRTLHYHVFETLPDIVAHVQRILEKFDDDDGYANMREYLAEQLPLVRASIENLAESVPADRVVKSLDGPGVKSRINTGLKAVVQALASPLVYYPTFTKLLKENGIPTNGAGLGLNLNREILNALVEFVEGWHNKMQTRTEDVAIKLDEPIQAVLKDLKKHIDSYEGNPDLKDRANELLETTTRRIGMTYGKMAALLQSTLRENHLLFSTEVNVKCPIALEMKDIYRNVLLQQLVQPGKGSYARQRAHLLERLVNPDWPKIPFADIMEQKIVNTQVGSWKQCCKQYVLEAMTLLQDFARATDELLNNDSHLTSERRRVREQLEALLPEFKRQLNRVQNQFPGPEASHTSASIQHLNTSSTRGPNISPNKRKAYDERAATQPPTSKPSDVKRLKTYSQPSQLRAMSAQPVAWLRGRLLSRLEQTQEPVIKRETSS